MGPAPSARCDAVGELPLAQLAVAALGKGEYAVLLLSQLGQVASAQRGAGDP